MNSLKFNDFTFFFSKIFLKNFGIWHYCSLPDHKSHPSLKMKKEFCLLSFFIKKLRKRRNMKKVSVSSRDFIGFFGSRCQVLVLSLGKFGSRASQKICIWKYSFNKKTFTFISVQMAAADGVQIPSNIFQGDQCCFACLQSGHMKNNCTSKWRQHYQDFIDDNKQNQRGTLGYWVTPVDTSHGLTAQIHSFSKFLLLAWLLHMAKLFNKASEPNPIMMEAAKKHVQERQIPEEEEDDTQPEDSEWCWPSTSNFQQFRQRHLTRVLKFYDKCHQLIFKII